MVFLGLFSPWFTAKVQPSIEVWMTLLLERGG